MSECDGACASAWPPLTTSGKPTAGAGVVAAASSGTAKRPDGTTGVTYDGHPLYTYAGDGAPGQTAGEGLTDYGAPWYAPLGRGQDRSGRNETLRAWQNPRSGATIRSSSSCSASRARPAFRALLRRLPRRGRGPLGAPRRRRADRRLHVRLRQPARSCGRSGCRPRRATATRCSRRCRRCAAAARSTRTSRVCESGEPWVHEVTYDTPFGDGYMLGTFVHRTAKLGDGLINFLTDVTEQRRMEAELRSYADVVAHDLSEPIAGIAMLVGLLERRADEPPSPAVLAPAAREHRARPRADRRRARLRAGGRAAAPSRSRSASSWPRSPRTCARASTRPARRSTSASCPRSRATRASCAACCRTCRERGEVPRRGAAAGRASRRCATARSGS